MANYIPGQLFAHKDWRKNQFTWKYYKITGIIHSKENPKGCTEEGCWDKISVVMVEKQSDMGEASWRDISAPFDILIEFVNELKNRGEIIFK